MGYYIGAFTQKSPYKLPKVTAEYLLEIGIKEDCMDKILDFKYEAVYPVWYDEYSRGTRYFLVRKGKSCGVIYDSGDFCSIELKYSTIIPPIKSKLFAVENRAGNWSVMDPSIESPIIKFGKYSYIWGFDDGLSLVKAHPKMEKTFEGRGVINEQGQEVVKPGLYNNVWDFYGRGYSNIIAEKQGNTILLNRSSLRGQLSPENYFLLNRNVSYTKISYNQRFSMYLLAQSFFEFISDEYQLQADRILCMYQVALKLNHEDFQRRCVGYSIDYNINVTVTIKDVKVWDEFFRIIRQMKEYSKFNNKAVGLYNRIRHEYLKCQK